MWSFREKLLENLYCKFVFPFRRERDIGASFCRIFISFKFLIDFVLPTNSTFIYIFETNSLSDEQTHRSTKNVASFLYLAAFAPLLLLLST